MIIIDETIMLRYLLDDDARLSKKAREIIARGDAFSYPEIIARCAVTLRDVYQVPRSVIGSALSALLEDITVDEDDVIRLAARLFGTTKLDFTDCMLVARNVLYGDEVASFDKPLMRQVIAAEAQVGAPGKARPEK